MIRFWTHTERFRIIDWISKTHRYIDSYGVIALPNIASAEKRMRQSIRRNLRNRAATSTIRTFVHRSERQLGASDVVAAEASVKLAVRALDKAAKKGIIHKNNAARRKSRLMRKLNAASAAQG